MNNKAHGFTIVELLIVIVVVGILAAISIVAYNGISNNANDTAIKNDLANFAKAAQLFHAERGAYPTVGQLDDLKLSVTKSSYDTLGYNLYYCTDGPASGGCTVSLLLRQNQDQVIIFMYLQRAMGRRAEALCMPLKPVSTSK